MRDDMFKVIVERPRWGSRVRTREGRAYRNGEDVPSKIGMKQGYTNRKWLNENLAPLRRWLESQVNRPWDKVYAELCANIDRRNMVQEHIFTHIDSFVECEARWLDDEVFVMERWPRKGLVPLREARVKLYVHPKTRILRYNKHYVARRKRDELAGIAADKEFAATCRVLSDFEQLRKIEGVWYHVTMAKMGLPKLAVGKNGGPAMWVYPQYWDVVKKEMVSLPHHQYVERERPNMAFVNQHRYAAAKRQLSNAELRRYELNNDANENAGNSRRFCFGESPTRIFTNLCEWYESRLLTVVFSRYRLKMPANNGLSYQNGSQNLRIRHSRTGALLSGMIFWARPPHLELSS